MINKNLNNACFVKFGCEFCSKYREFQFMYYGAKYQKCKDEFLSFDEKVKKILYKYENR